MGEFKTFTVCLEKPFAPMLVTVYEDKKSKLRLLPMRELFDALEVKTFSHYAKFSTLIRPRYKVKIGVKNNVGVTINGCIKFVEEHFNNYVKEEKEKACEQLRKIREEHPVEQEDEESSSSSSSSPSNLPKKRERPPTVELWEKEVAPAFDSFRTQVVGNFSQVIAMLEKRAEDAEKRLKVAEEQNDMLRKELGNFAQAILKKL